MKAGPRQFTGEQMQILRESHLFDSMTDSDIEAIVKLCVTRRDVARREVLFREYDTADRFWIVLDGKLESYRFSNALDRDNFVFPYSKGEFIGLEFWASHLQKSALVVVSVYPCILAEIKLPPLPADTLPDGAVWHITNNSKMILGDECVRRQRQIGVMGVGSVRDRLLAFLDYMRDKTGSDAFHIKMNQQQLASYFGIARPSLTTVLRQLRKENLIDFEGDYYTVKTNPAEADNS
ncbi:MAG: Crp/Fnr family transcriptional regulator [Clostridiales Family XIII bacterium]|jgi:CRP-like cAMP-binding protein|nr:Crp/Fnr family transcriptional regulator [Clostridiales Family XIII bacterium]